MKKSWLRRFVEIGREEKMLFFEACLMQTASGIALRLLPFRHILRLYRCTMADKDQCSKEADAYSAEVSMMIKTALRRSAPLVIWKNRCLVQSLAARIMLNRRNVPSQLCIGAVKENGAEIKTHAWISAYSFEVVEKNGNYVVLYCF